LVTQRRIDKRDWKKVEQFVKDEHHRRKTSQFRTKWEEKWKEVDRQLKMEQMHLVSTDGHSMEPEWESNIELGELAKVSEVVSADVMRITFPAERDWFDPHVEIPGEEGPQEPLQTIADNSARNMFIQQHEDFGFSSRFELSVKEALHHGSFVAEADWYEDMMVMDGTKVKHIAAPVWVPHSMWNCYPDDSPRCVTQNMFYNGSMIIESFMPRWKMEMQRGDGWMPARFKDVPQEEHNVGEDGQQRQIKDLQIVSYYGDVVIERKAGDDIYLPNSKVMCANGVLVYWNSNILPYSPIIYNGYEKQDVRDPYYMSPLIKLSAITKSATVSLNEFLNGVSLANKPPIVYDANDPEFAMNGGPQIFPGAAMGSKGGADFKQVQIGDPLASLQGLELLLRVIQEGTGVNSIRAGAPTSDRKTAFEVDKVAQGAEVRTIDFIRKLNGSLRTFLYMQHALNLKKLKEYSFYSDDMDSKDFQRITGPEYRQTPVIRFDVVGAKGILGEEQRMQRQTQVTAFASGNPLFAPLLKPRELLMSMYKDAGTKNPERFVNAEGQMEDPRLAQMQQVIQQLQGELAQAQEKTEIEIAKLEQKREEALAKLSQAQESKQIDMEQKEKDRIADYTKHIQDLRVQMEMQARELTGQFNDVLKDVTHKLELFKAQQDKPVSVVQTKDAALDGELKGISEEVRKVMEKASKRKKRTVKFIDDDTAEIVDEGDLE
jgi:hypothetical protein